MMKRIVRKVRTVASPCLAIVLLTVGAQNESRAQESNCANSTVADALGPKVAEQAKAVLAELQKAVQGDDAVAVGQLVHYPVRVIGKSGTTKIARRSAFAQKYSSIVTPAVKKAILAQSAECLFGNWQGVMVGNGEVWFQQQPDGKMRIVTINTTSP